MTISRFLADESLLLAIDLQEKLVPIVANATNLLARVRLLLEVAHQLKLPVIATEQYPRGLGETVPNLRQLLPHAPLSKTTFSCLACPALSEQIILTQREQVVVVGVESHVCVQQTVIDLLDMNKRPIVVADAVSSRHRLDHEVALTLMQRAGATITTTEALVFAWLKDSQNPAFKMASKLVKELPANSTD